MQGVASTLHWVKVLKVKEPKVKGSKVKGSKIKGLIEARLRLAAHPHPQHTLVLQKLFGVDTQRSPALLLLTFYALVLWEGERHTEIQNTDIG